MGDGFPIGTFLFVGQRFHHRPGLLNIFCLSDLLAMFATGISLCFFCQLTDLSVCGDVVFAVVFQALHQLVSHQLVSLPFQFLDL